MKKQKLLRVSSVILVLFSAFASFMVSVMAMVDPQGVMDLVQVKLSNNDAYSSIRGVYGGVGITLVCLLIYLAVRHVKLGVAFIALFVG